MGPRVRADVPPSAPQRLWSKLARMLPSRFMRGCAIPRAGDGERIGADTEGFRPQAVNRVQATSG
jgi:hypothetical protein